MIKNKIFKSIYHNENMKTKEKNNFNILIDCNKLGVGDCCG